MFILQINKARQRANWGTFVILVAACFKLPCCSARQNQLCGRARKMPRRKHFFLKPRAARGLIFPRPAAMMAVYETGAR